MKNWETKIKAISIYGKRAVGDSFLVNYLEGGKLSSLQAIKAKCYDCNGCYGDGKVDCKVDSCPLYPFMPYRENKEPKKKRNMTELQKEQSKDNLKRARFTRQACFRNNN